MQERIDYLDYLKVVRAGRSTILQASRVLFLFESYLPERDKVLQAFDADDLILFVAYLRKPHPPNNKGLTDRSILRYLNALKRFFKWCIRRKKHPSRHIGELWTEEFLEEVQPREPMQLPNYVSQEDVFQFLETAPLRLKAIAFFLYDTGCRVGEALEIKLKELNFEERRVKIYQAKQRTERYAYFSEITDDILQKYIREKNPSKFLFVDRSGQAYGRTPRGTDYIRSMFMTHCRRLWGEEEKKRIRPHDLRRAHITHRMEQGGSIRVIQDGVGHKNIASTQVYAAVTEQLQRKSLQETHPLHQGTFAQRSIGKKIAETETVMKDLMTEISKMREQYEAGSEP